MTEITEDLNELQSINFTELAYIFKRQTGLIIKRSVSITRLIQLLEEGGLPLADEISPTTDSRKRLQIYVEKNWNAINSQLPCKGDNRGRCTIYNCPEGRHIDCLLSATPHMNVHGL